MYLPDGVECDLCQAKLLEPVPDRRASAAARAGWEWFTGPGDPTVHFCRPCQRGQAAEIEAMRTEAHGGYRSVRPMALKGPHGVPLVEGAGI